MYIYSYWDATQNINRNTKINNIYGAVSIIRNVINWLREL